MSKDVSLHRDLLTLCEEYLETVDDDVRAYLADWRAAESDVMELDWSTLEAFDSDLEADFRQRPTLVAAHIEKALRAWFTSDVAGENAEEETTVRFVGYDDDRVLDVGQYAPDSVAGRLIHLRGQVTHRTKRKLRDEIIAFECLRCGRVTTVPQSGDMMQEPQECGGCERQGPFSVDDRRTVMRDYQSIRLQTLPEEAERGESEHITIRVHDEMVGSLSPGDRAILNVEMRGKRQKQTRVRELEGTVHGLTRLTSDHQDVEIDPYETEIREIAAGAHDEFDSPYPAIIDSIAPFHEGDDHIKEALAYQLFGGVEKQLPDGSWMRGNSHVLLMGDPGTGKTSIIRYVSNLVPRSEYATGKKSTSAGLTATATKDDFAEGGWSLQAGTLVKAHNGLAAIDELDKMDPEDRDGMIEAMSEQKITVSMVVSGVLPAKCSVLAAANPKYGSFDPMKDIGNQLDLDSVLLSRFDLWFVMRDEPEEELDTDIARTMTETAAVGQKVASGASLDSHDEDRVEPPISPEMFRAYVALGKQCFPVFTDEAKDRIVSEYVKLRQMNSGDGPVPTTARIVEALHRLSEASARMRLAESVTIDDVERAIAIQRESMESLGVDPESGELDAMRMETGSTSSKHDRVKALSAIITGQEGSDGKPAAKADVKEEAMVLMSESEYEDAYEALRRKDEIIEPTSDEVRTI